jgi:site-specific DNA-methyltransferase (cytosine-N4-specific)
MFDSHPYTRNFCAQNAIEFINIFVKDGTTLLIKETSKLTEKGWIECTKQIWNMPMPSKNNLAFGKHSVIMPAEIVHKYIKLFTFEGDLVLDPFMWNQGQH